MRRFLLLGLGAGVGYVMGTRAGRGRYLEMKNAWEKAVHEGSLSQVSKKFGETKLGETLGMKQSSGASMSTGSTYSGASTPYTTGTQTMAEEAGTSVSGVMDSPESSSITDLRDSADDTARGF